MKLQDNQSALEAIICILAENKAKLITLSKQHDEIEDLTSMIFRLQLSSLFVDMIRCTTSTQVVKELIKDTWEVALRAEQDMDE